MSLWHKGEMVKIYFSAFSIRDNPQTNRVPLYCKSKYINKILSMKLSKKLTDFIRILS